MDRYEEALAKARAEYEKASEQGYTWLMGLLEGMFPELKESEDERVRQAIIAVVQWAECFNASSVTHEAAETMLAWLEKRKDLDKMIVVSPEVWDNAIHDAYENGKKDNEKQKDERELDFAEGKVEGVKQTCQEIKEAMSLFEPKDLTPFEFTFRDYIDSAIRHCLSGEGYQQYIKEWAADLLNLEKQKEQKPTNEEMLRTLRVEYEKGVADTIAKYEQKEQKPMESALTDFELKLYTVISAFVCEYERDKEANLIKFVKEYSSVLLESAKEQKFTEKQDYSDLTDLERAIHRGFLVVGVENVPVTIIKETAQDCLAWMKPAKWSEDWREEDIQTRFAFYTYKDDPSVLYLSNVFVEETSRNHGFGTRILRAAEKVAEAIGATTISLKVKQNSPVNAWYRKNGYGYVAFEDGYDWLEKNLEYMKPNKQEWSEEDKETFEKLRRLLVICRGEKKFIQEADYNKMDNLLKSLRPPQYCENCKLKRSVENWKPGKEQMGMLLAVINDPNNAGAESCHLMLQSLYADLKKLL